MGVRGSATHQGPVLSVLSQNKEAISWGVSLTQDLGSKNEARKETVFITLPAVFFVIVCAYAHTILLDWWVPVLE